MLSVALAAKLCLYAWRASKKLSPDVLPEFSKAVDSLINRLQRNARATCSGRGCCTDPSIAVHRFIGSKATILLKTPHPPAPPKETKSLPCKGNVGPVPWYSFGGILNLRAQACPGSATLRMSTWHRASLSPGGAQSSAALGLKAPKAL